MGDASSSDVPGTSDLTGGDAAADQAVSSDGGSDVAKAGEIEIGEGESLHDIKERIKREKKNSAKPTIPPELLNSAKSYEDKVGVVRMVVQQDNSRVAGVIRGMIEVK
jgi:flagellar M-ring protein FliF